MDTFIYGHADRHARSYLSHMSAYLHHYCISIDERMCREIMEFGMKVLN